MRTGQEAEWLVNTTWGGACGVCSCSRVLGEHQRSLRGSPSRGARPGREAWASQHGPAARPPAQPGSIWVASGRSAAKPAVAELRQDPPLRTPAHSRGSHSTLHLGRHLGHPQPW